MVKQFSSYSVSLLVMALAACSPQGDKPLQGYAEGEFIRIAAPYAGTLTKLQVQRGDQVQNNAPLFVLEQENEKAARLEAQERLHSAEAQLENLRKGKRPSELDAARAQLTQARALLKQSELDYRRDEKLAASGFISPQRADAAHTALKRDQARVVELEAQLATAQMGARHDEIAAAEASVKAARAALQQAEWRLAQKTVNATATGLVQDTLFVQGEWVPAGSPVISLLPPQNIKLRFFVPEQHVAKLHPGQPVQVSCDGCGAPIKASISYISPQAEYTPPVIYSKENRNKLVFLIEARPSPADAIKLHPGQPVDVTL